MTASTDAVAIQASLLREIAGPLTVEELWLDPPGPGEVRVRIAAAGVCHSDLHLAEGGLGRERVPTVLGHEGAGIVEAVGPGVGERSVGDRVALCFIPACGACGPCRAGRPNLCEPGSASSFAGTMPDGGFRLHLADGSPVKHFLGTACFAERCVVPVASTVPIPPALPLWQAALVGCAVVTGFGAVRNAGRVQAGQATCVIGCGGVGLQVIAALRLAGADPIVAVDTVEEKLERALARGATAAVDASDEKPARAIRKLTGGGAEVAFEVVGSRATIRLGWDALRPGGTVVVVGLAPEGVDAAVPANGFLSEKTLRGSFYGSGDPAAEISDLARLVAEGGLDVAGAVSHLTGLDGIAEAFERMRAGVGARTVVVVDAALAGVPASGEGASYLVR